MVQSCQEAVQNNVGKVYMALSKLGRKVLVHNCPRLPTSVRRQFPLERGPKGPQKCTIIVDDCAQIAESGLTPPFESPHLNFPNASFGFSEPENYQHSTESQKYHNKSLGSAGNNFRVFLFFLRRRNTSTEFLPLLRPDASAPVKVKLSLPSLGFCIGARNLVATEGRLLAFLMSAMVRRKCRRPPPPPLRQFWLRT